MFSPIGSKPRPLQLAAAHLFAVLKTAHSPSTKVRASLLRRDDKVSRLIHSKPSLWRQALVFLSNSFQHCCSRLDSLNNLAFSKILKTLLSLSSAWNDSTVLPERAQCIFSPNTTPRIRFQRSSGFHSNINTEVTRGNCEDRSQRVESRF